MRLHILFVCLLVGFAASSPFPGYKTVEEQPTGTNVQVQVLRKIWDRISKLPIIGTFISQLKNIFSKSETVEEPMEFEEGSVFKRILEKLKGLSNKSKERLNAVWKRFKSLPIINRFFEVVIENDAVIEKTAGRVLGIEVHLAKTVLGIEEAFASDILTELFEHVNSTLKKVEESNFLTNVVTDLMGGVAEEFNITEIEEALLLVPWDMLNVTLNLKVFNDKSIQELIDSLTPLMNHISKKLFKHEDMIFDKVERIVSDEVEESGLEENGLTKSITEFRNKLVKILGKIKNSPIIRKLIPLLTVIDIGEGAEKYGNMWSKIKKIPIVGKIIELLKKTETVPDAPEPDAPEPDVPVPDAPEPDAPEPDVPVPDAPEPGATEPDSPEPEVSERVAMLKETFARINFDPILNKLNGINKELKAKIYWLYNLIYPNILLLAQFQTSPPTVRKTVVIEETGLLKHLFDDAGDFLHFQELFSFAESTLDTVADSSILAGVVNGLIHSAADKLPLNTVEEALALLPWEQLEHNLLHLHLINVEDIQELVHSLRPFVEHVVHLLSSHEDVINNIVQDALSADIRYFSTDAGPMQFNYAHAGRKAELLLNYAADAITNDNLRYFTKQLTEDITNVIKSSPTAARCSGAQNTTSMKVVCYYPNWVYYRKGAGKYTVDDIDTSLCTHIIYSFVILDGEQHIIKAHDTWLDIDRSGSRGWNLGNFRKFTALKKSNPNAKYMLALGGWNDSKMPKYSELLASASKIDRFVEHAVGFLKEYGFDGLDLDYEYPSYDGHGRDAPDSDKPGFTLLCKKLSEAFKAHDYELTAAVSASKTVIDNAYEIPEISKYLDAIHMMSYDLHGSWEKMVNHHSPLYGAEWDTLTTDFGANYWVSQGCPKHKLIVGIPTYGRSWTLGGWDSSAWEYDINSTARAAGEAGPLTRAKGFLAYNEICQFVQNDGWTVVSDPTNNMGPYAYKGSQWVGYDDPAIARVKAQYILDNQFGGAMFWDLPSDDFGNLCGGGRYPIIGAVSSVLKSQNTGRCQEETPRHL